MKCAKAGFMALSLILMMSAAAPPASAQAEHVRWDIMALLCGSPLAPCGLTVVGGKIVYINLAPPFVFNPGGSATALAGDCYIQAIPTNPLMNGCSFITLTGHGTFVAPASGGSASAVDGGGTWEVAASCTSVTFPPTGPPNCVGGTITRGTFQVTELVQWEKSTPQAPAACYPCNTTDNIGNLREATGGLAILRVAYSDGTTGTLTLSCAGAFDPQPVTEGVTASKGVILPDTEVPPKLMPFPVLFWNSGDLTYFTMFHVY